MKGLRFVMTTAVLGLSTISAQVQFDPYSKVPPQHTAAEILQKAIHALEGVKSMEYEVRTVPAPRSPLLPPDPDVKYAGRTKIIATPGAPIQYWARFVAEDPKTIVLAVSNGDKVRISEGAVLAEYPTRVMEDEASEAALPTLQMFDTKRLRKSLDANNAIYAGREDIEGEMCYIVGLPSLFEGEDGSDTDYYWFSAATGLPKSRMRFRIMHGRVGVTVQWILSGLRLNTDVPPETFKYHPTEADSTPTSAAQKAAEAALLTMVNAPGPKRGDTVPELEVRDFDYKPVSLRKVIEGKATIITLWAPWCSPCVGELPVFEKLVERYGGKLQVIALGVQDSRIAFADYAKKHPELHFIWLTDPNLEDFHSKVNSYFAGLGIPRNLYVDADGKVHEYAPGYGGKEDVLIKKVEAWMDGTSANRD